MAGEAEGGGSEEPMGEGFWVSRRLDRKSLRRAVGVPSETREVNKDVGENEKVELTIHARVLADEASLAVGEYDPLERLVPA